MSVSYTWVGWNRHKKIYDGVMVAVIAAYIALFVVIARLAGGQAAPSDETLIIRACGTGALLLLHIVLSIGPLARLDPRFLPLLYNRRHLGVATFLLALLHAAFAIVQYHAFGDVNPFVSLLTSNTHYGSLTRFPFEVLGLAALVILFLMAATSHDFWLKNLTPRIWKSLHMAVYFAYTLLVMHVVLGYLQSEKSPITTSLLVIGAAITVSLHLVAGRREVRNDKGLLATNGFLDAGQIDDIPNNRAKVVCTPGGERIAVFRYDGKVSAVSNVCEHQGGPLGEGKVIDGCITCPWHGYQYRPGDGCSPPPFTEQISTYEVRLQGRRILVNPDPRPRGTPVAPATFEETGHA